MAHTPLHRSTLRAPLISPPALPQPEQSPISRTLEKGTLGLRASGRGALAAVGAAVGQEGFARKQLKEAKGLRQRASDIKPGGIENVQDVKGVGDALNFAGTQIVKNLPGIATTVATALPAAKLGKVIAKASKGGKGAQATAQKVGAGAGVVGAVGAQEAGEIFPGIAEDPNAKGTLQEQAQVSLGGAGLAASFELLPAFAVFRRLGIGKAAKQSILKRVSQGAAIGALSEAPVEAAQTLVEKATHKFVNDNIDLFDDEALAEYLNAAAAGFAVGGAFGGVGGAAAPSVAQKLDQRIEDLDAADELDSARTNSQIEQIRQADPTAAAQLNPFDAESVQTAYSRTFKQEDPLARVARSFLSRNSELNTPENEAVFNEEVMPFLQDIIDGTTPGSKSEEARRKKVEDVLRTHFVREPQEGQDNETPLYDDMIQALARFSSSRRDIEQMDIAEREEVQAEELADPAAAAAAGFQSRVTTPDNRTITLNKQERPWRSKELNTAVAGKSFGATSLDKAIKKRNTQDRENIYNKVSYREYLTEQMNQQGVAPAERDAALAQQAEAFAAEEIGSDERLAALFDPNDPIAFLEQFDAVEVVPIAELAGEVDSIDIKQAETRKIFKRASDPRKALPRGDFQISVDGVTTNVNAGDLVRMMMPKVAMEGASLTPERVGDLFSTGLSSVLSLDGKEVTLKKDIPDDLVVFTDGSKREYTFGEIKVQGAATFLARMNRTRAARDKFEPGTEEFRVFNRHVKKLDDARKELGLDIQAERDAAAAAEDISIDLQGNIEEEKIEGAAADPKGTFTATPDLQTKAAPILELQKDIRGSIRSIKSTTTFEAAQAIYKELFGQNAKAKTALGVKEALRDQLSITRTKIKKLNVGETRQRQEEETTKPKKVSFSKKRGKDGPTTETLDEIFVAGKEDVNNKARKLFSKLLAGAGIKGKAVLLTGTDAVAILKQSPNEAWALVSKRSAGVTFSMKDGKYVVIIDPRESAEKLVSTIGHEFGHVVMFAAMKESAAGKAAPMPQAIRDSFERWRAQVKGSTTIGDIAKGRFSFHTYTSGKRQSWAAGGDLSVEGLDADTKSYLLDYEEWFAEHVSKWLTTETKPLGIIEEFFAAVAAQLKKLFGVLKDSGFTTDKAVSDYMNALYNFDVGPVAEEKIWTSLQDNIDFVSHSKTFDNDVVALIEKITGRKVQVLSDAEQDIYVSEMTKIIYISDQLTRDPTGKVLNQVMQASLDIIFTEKERGVLYNAFSSDTTLAQLNRLLKGDKEAQALVKNNLDAAVAYGYQFWMAGELTLGPKTKDAADRALDMLYQVAGLVQNHDQANEILNEMTQGTLGLREKGEANFIVRANVSETRIQRAVKKALAISDLVMPLFRKVFFAGDWTMRATNNAHMVKIADLIQPESGGVSKAEGMFEARKRFVGTFVNTALDIFKGKSDKFGSEVLEALQNPNITPSNPSQAKAVRKVRELMRGMRTYAISRGVKVGDKGKDYFPWVFDRDYMQNNAKAFMDLINQKKYAGERAKIAESLDIPEEYVAQTIYSNIVASNGNADVAVDTTKVGHTPNMDSLNTRSLSWITDLGNANDKAALAKFFNKDIGQTLMQYVEQTVKRAEYTQRFGNGKIESLMDKAKTSGASKAELDTAKKYLDAVMGVSGLELNPIMVKAYEVFFGPMDQAQKVAAARQLRTIQGNIMVYVNFVQLGLSAFTSLADPIGIAVRSGDIETPWKAYKAGIGEIYSKIKGNKTELRLLAETVGVINQKMVSEALGQEFGGVYMTGFARKANEALFKYNGLQGLTRFTRLMALEAGRSFIVKHRSGTFNKSSKRYLEQLDLTPADIKVDDKGQLIVDNDKMSVALNRFVDGAILNPNAAQRPIWASDPHAMLVFHLKQFMYSFEDRILSRVYREMREGNYTPFLLLWLWVPTMVAADYLRDLIQFGVDGNPRKADWSPMDYANHGAERSGIFGVTQILTDARNDIKFGGIGVESFLGPTASQLTKVPKLFAEDDNQQWRAFVGSLPGQNVYKNWDWGGSEDFGGVSGRYGL